MDQTLSGQIAQAIDRTHEITYAVSESLPGNLLQIAVRVEMNQRDAATTLGDMAGE